MVSRSVIVRYLSTVFGLESHGASRGPPWGSGSFRLMGRESHPAGLANPRTGAALLFSAQGALCLRVAMTGQPLGPWRATAVESTVASRVMVRAYVCACMCQGLHVACGLASVPE